MEPTETIEAAFGRAVKTERDEHGITLDQLATTMREHGVRWSTARVIEFEKGRLRLTVPMLLAITKSLELLTKRGYALGDLLPDDMPLVKITEQWVTPTHLVREVLSGVVTPLPIIVGDVESFSGIREESALEEDRRAGAGPLTATLAEERAARRIGVRPRQIAMWAGMLWGSHLDDEVARRAGADASAQARGHITRELVAEIGRHIDEHREPADG